MTADHGRVIESSRDVVGIFKMARVYGGNDSAIKVQSATPWASHSTWIPFTLFWSEMPR